jgi:signal transduction histidine kinase
MPLSAIINYAEMIKLLFSATLSPEVSLYLSRISDSADVMTNMVTQLLWVARLENPVESLSSVDMGEVIDVAVHRLNHAISTRGVTMKISPDLLPVLAHDVWMEEVMVNLISNAVKYMGEDNKSPIIRIRASQKGTVVRYEIEDNGIGIRAEDQSKLFQSFSRLNAVQSEGLGLGLVIVQRMIARLGGEIGVISYEGKGSCFWFTLPAPPPQS